MSSHFFIDTFHHDEETIDRGGVPCFNQDQEVISEHLIKKSRRNLL